MNEEINEGTWDGIRALICARVKDGSFGASYPATCDDGHGLIGCDESTFWKALRAEVPALRESSPLDLSGGPPQTLDILDTIEFCWRCVGKPSHVDHHKFFSHYHLQFDIEVGRDEFRNDINRIFRRNGLAYDLTEEGHVERLVPAVLRETLSSVQFLTGDTELDRILKTAQRKFSDPDDATRHEALEALWDAWERLKTLGSGRDKKMQVTSLLDGAAGSSSTQFRKVLEQEAKELTWIGNNLQIRHSEASQERLAQSEHVDYLFHRLFGLVQMILRMRS